jgi:hypothetical protein
VTPILLEALTLTKPFCELFVQTKPLDSEDKRTMLYVGAEKRIVYLIPDDITTIRIRADYYGQMKKTQAFASLFRISQEEVGLWVGQAKSNTIAIRFE